MALDLYSNFSLLTKETEKDSYVKTLSRLSTVERRFYLAYQYHSPFGEDNCSSFLNYITNTRYKNLKLDLIPLRKPDLMKTEFATIRADNNEQKELKQAFILNLLQVNPEERIRILNEQYAKNPLNLSKIQQALRTLAQQNVTAIASSQNYGFLLADIDLVESTPTLHQKEFATLKPNQQRQFITGLLFLTEFQQQQFIVERFTENSADLENLKTYLENDRSIPYRNEINIFKNHLNNAKELQANFNTYQTWLADIEEALTDPTTQEADLLTDSYITPGGNTYNYQSMQTWFAKQENDAKKVAKQKNQTYVPEIRDDEQVYVDPSSNIKFIASELIPNKLVNNLTNYFQQKDFKSFFDALKSPTTSFVFDEPTVGDDGNTYERGFLTRRNPLLDGSQQQRSITDANNKPLYVNRVVDQIIELSKPHLENLTGSKVIPISNSIKQDALDKLIKNLENHAKARDGEKNYTGSRFGYDRKTKVDAMKNLANTLRSFKTSTEGSNSNNNNDAINPNSFFTDKKYKKSIAALEQGKTKDIAKEALDYVRQHTQLKR